MTGSEDEGLRVIATSRNGALLSQAPASAVSISSITVRSAASALSEIWTRTVAWEGSLVKPTCRCACQERAAIWTGVPAISMQARGPAKNSPRANKATIASGTTEARIFKRNMIRDPLSTSPRRGAYGWQSVKETSYRGVDAGCFVLGRQPCGESSEATPKRDGAEDIVARMSASDMRVLPAQSPGIAALTRATLLRNA